jgi:hypothetical protein
MSVYPAPTGQQGSIFNPSIWIISDINGVSVQYLDENYLRYPVAQGYETLNGMTNLSNGTFEKNIVMSGTYLTNYLEFPDGSQQFTADTGGGTGDAQLSGGTSSTPQTFTGYNEFDNANGRITLGNTTDTTKVKLEADADQNDQLNINGQVSIGNPTNGNTIILNSDSTTSDQLNIYGQMAMINSSGSAIQLVCDDASIQLNINGQLALVDGGGDSVVLSSDSGTNNQLNINGAVKIVNPADSYAIYLEAIADDTNSTYNLQITNGGISLGSELGSPGDSTYVSFACDGSVDNQLNVGGALQTSGQLIITGSGNGITFADSSVQTVAYTGQVPSGAASLSDGTSSTPQTFTGYNKINLLQYNGMSCPQKVVSNSVASSSSGSVWTFNVGTLSTSYGKAISFSISTNNNNPSQPLETGAYVTDSTGILIGTGYGVNQPYTISGVSGSFSAYILYMTNFTNVSSWYFLTEVASTADGAIYNCYVNDSNYYAQNNIQLTMYISPTAVI